MAFLRDVVCGDVALIAFLQRWCGYSLTGDTREQKFVFIYGDGGNGKGIFVGTIAGILHDYAINVPMEVLTASRFDRHSTELARLRGARMARSSETEEGRAWAENKIKSLTGGTPSRRGSCARTTSSSCLSSSSLSLATTVPRSRRSTMPCDVVSSSYRSSLSRSTSTELLDEKLRAE